MDKVKAFGVRLAKTRERRRMSTQELAERAEVSYQTVWRLERGQQGEPKIFTVASLARVLDVSIDYLAGVYKDQDSEPKAAAVALV